LPQTKYVEGEDSTFMLLFIPLGLPQLEDAVDDALNKGNGDLMTDVVVHDKSWTAILFGKLTISVKGTVVNTKN
ncbi:MAG: hypothetical protein K8I00_08105, partial [Candidatus Omnitrophica bacterium]|nr:hypothetical protein [Candidatus Omnitrophota bacterium]